MTVMEAVKRSKTLVFKKAVEAAQQALTPEESLLWAQTGNVTLDETLGGTEKGVKPGVAIVTTHRLVFVYAIMNQRFTRHLLIPDISIVQQNRSSLQVSGAGGSMTIEGSALNLPQLKAALDEAMANAAALEPWVPPITEESPAESAPSEPAAAPETPSVPDVDLEPYFQKYYPSRMKAVAALHRDTDLELSQCKSLIEAYFSANLARIPMPERDTTPDLRHLLDPEKAKQMDELDAQGIVYCPKCASTSVTAGKRGFSVGKAAIGSMFSLGTGLLAGAIGSNKIQCTCLKCGHTWKP